MRYNSNEFLKEYVTKPHCIFVNITHFHIKPENTPYFSLVKSTKNFMCFRTRNARNKKTVRINLPEKHSSN